MEEVAKRRLFVPPLPTLWPSMLWGEPSRSKFPPFATPGARYFYFARNAVWHSAKMLGLEGGEVLVPSYHHGVEVEALVDAGVKVTFYRVGARWDVDLADVAKKIGPRTRALYLIHYAGFPGPVEQMRALADKHQIAFIEDCALSLLSSKGTVPLGTTGDVGIFCLYKTLPVPNGGALIVNPERGCSFPSARLPPPSSTFSHLTSSLLQNLELRAGVPGRWARNAVRGLGRNTVRAADIERVATGTQHFDRAHVELGMSPLSLKIALCQDMNAIVEKRRRNYFYLLGALEGVCAPLFSQLPPGVCPLFYPLMVEQKAELMERLLRRGIETVDFWRDFHPACEATEFPEVAKLRRTVLEIPCHQDLTPEMMVRLAAEVKAAFPRSSPRA